ncbi:hypothetical protein BC835DRAFT_616051 [Cytidiella melzeri]|nr:hypothetical protein BC835DRAFT_616051 [Cytidiella melzeri]
MPNSHFGPHSHSRSRRSAAPPSMPSKSVHPKEHRRTQSSPFSYLRRPSPFAFDPQTDCQSHPTHTSALPQPFYESISRYSPYPASLPPRTVSSVTSTELIPGRGVDLLNYQSQEAASGDEEDSEETFAFSPIRRRISFSTSAERDTPFVPEMPVIPPVSHNCLPELNALWTEGMSRKEVLGCERVGRERNRGLDKVPERLTANEGKRRAQEMLPTPPLSSPELELAQPLPQHHQHSSQPSKREPSIPVGSIAANLVKRNVTPMRERKHKERPTLMDLLSSPQPSVSPERLSVPPFSVVSESGHCEQRDRVLSPLREGPRIAQYSARDVEDESLGRIGRDGSLPPSSPFSSPLSSPAKCSRMSSSPPRVLPPSPVDCAPVVTADIAKGLESRGEPEIFVRVSSLSPNPTAAAVEGRRSVSGSSIYLAQETYPIVQSQRRRGR